MTAALNPAFCYVTDVDYLAPTLISIASLRKTLSTKLPIFLILTRKDGDNLPDLKLIYDRLSIQIIPLHYSLIEHRSKVWAASHVTKAAMGRLLLHDLLPAEIDKIVYIDGDTYAMKDLAALAAAPLPSGNIGMVEDAISFFRTDNSGNGRTTREYLSRIGLKPDDPYGNSGVMVASRDDWKSLSLDALEYLQHFSDLCPPYHDQSAINAVIGTRRVKLSTKWNFQSRFAQWDGDNQSEAALLHFTGAEKPWMGSVYPWRSISSEIAASAANFDSLGLPVKIMSRDEVNIHNSKFNDLTYTVRRYLDVRLQRRPRLIRDYDNICLL